MRYAVNVLGVVHSRMSWGKMPDVGRSWWRHQMEIFAALLALCAGKSPVTGEFPAQRPVTRRFDVFFDLHPNKRLSKQWWGWWFETPSRPLWCHSNVVCFICLFSFEFRDCIHQKLVTGLSERRARKHYLKSDSVNNLILALVWNTKHRQGHAYLYTYTLHTVQY